MVINARGKKKKTKKNFYRTESVAMTPKSRDHSLLRHSGESCKMANSSSEDETDTLPERPTIVQGYSRISLSLPGRILKEYRYCMGFAKSALTEVLATQMGVMRRSKKVSSVV